MLLGHKLGINPLYVLVVFCFFVFSAHNQTIGITPLIRQRIEPDNLKPVITKLPNIKLPPLLLNRDQAFTYKGVTEINVPQGKSNRIQYFISFSKYTQACSYAACYYGWVDNYTIDGEDTVQGYPQGTDDVKPIFILQANSKNDFSITRNPKLQEAFVNVIELGCQLFQPTIKSVSRRSDSPTLATNLKTLRLNTDRLKSQNQTPQDEYAFILESQFRKLNPQTDQRAKSFFFAKPSIFSFTDNAETDSSKREQLQIAVLSKKLRIKDLQVNKDDLNQQIAVDKNYNIVRRSRIVDLDLKSESFNQGQEPLRFLSNLNILFQVAGKQNTNHGTLKNYINSFSIRAQQISFKKLDIEGRRKIALLNENFKIIDQLTQKPNELILKENNIVPQFAKSIKLCNQNPITGQKSIFTFTKDLFEKTILGKKFKVVIKIDATIVDQKKIRFKGIITYQLFGSTKNVEVFNYIKDISFTWSSSYPINGSWSFSIYIPLPPPVSFLGINFSFTVSFGLNVDLYAKGNPIAACVYKFEVGANVGTQVGVDASAAVRAIAIQGGVFISGILVRLSTDPKLSVALNVQTKSIVTSVTWYFYLNAFSFEWGFFYRYWKLFKGWSSRKIIAKWPISNGVTKKYLIYQS